MKIRGVLLIALSLLLAFFVVNLVNARVKSAPASGVKIVTAKTALSFGDRLTADNLRLVNFPADLGLDGTFASIEELAGSGRLALRPMAPGEPVLATKISGPGGKATLSTIVDKDMRAMTIRVNDV